MKKSYNVIFAAILMSLSLNAQNANVHKQLEIIDESKPGYVPPPPIEKEPEISSQDKIFIITEIPPTYGDGRNETIESYLKKNLKYPKDAKVNGIEGTVYMRFIVEKDGSLKDISVRRGICSSCNLEALRLVEAMPKWNPGKQNGQAVRVAYTLPIKFRLE